MDDISYILKEALTGLEHLFGIPATEDKGFEDIFAKYFKDGVLYFDVFYERLPDLPDLNPKACERLRRILNATIKSVIKRLRQKNVGVFIK